MSYRMVYSTTTQCWSICGFPTRIFMSLALLCSALWQTWRNLCWTRTLFLTCTSVCSRICSGWKLSTSRTMVFRNHPAAKCAEFRLLLTLIITQDHSRTPTWSVVGSFTILLYCRWCINYVLCWTVVACDDATTCTEPDGSTFAVTSCHPQSDQVCPDYFFNSAQSVRGSLVVVALAIVVSLLAEGLLWVLIYEFIDGVYKSWL
jgi:hypothetical protein